MRSLIEKSLRATNVSQLTRKKNADKIVGI
jgi:hypothetical protein